MGVSRGLRRLLRVRDLEAEQARLELESALRDLHALEQARAAATAWDRRGRRLVERSTETGEMVDRLAGIEETRTAERFSRALAPRIAGREQDVTWLREEYLARRVERRQAETLIEEAETRDGLERDRRSQQALDDWFRNRLHRAGEDGAEAEKT